MSNIADCSLEDRVRAIAFTLWVEEGMPEGRAECHWFRALELVNAEAAVQPERKSPAAAPSKKLAAVAVAKKAVPRKRG